MPILLGMPAFAPLTNVTMRPSAFGSLVGHVVYGIVLGATYVRLHHPHGMYPTPHTRPV
jgi:hypothetical protein